MGKRNRKKGSSGSESEDLMNPSKQRKDSDNNRNTNVSDVLSQTNSIPYDNQELFINDPSCDLHRVLHPVVIEKTSKTSKRETMAAKGGSPGEKIHGESPSRTELCVNEKLDTLIRAVNDIKSNQCSFKRMFETKLDALRTDLIENIDTKVRALRDELSMDLSRESCRIDNVVKSIQSLQGRLDTVESSRTPDNRNDSNGTGNHSSVRRSNGYNPDDPDVAITASGIPFTEGENLLQKAESLINALGEEVSFNVCVTKAARLPTRFHNRPALVKISFQNVDEKILVLRNKMNLKDSDNFKNVYLKSCKSHVERLIELNARAIIQQLPQGRSLRVDANGRIKQRVQREEQGQ